MSKTYIDSAPQDVLERAFGPRTENDLFQPTNDERLAQLLAEFEAIFTKFYPNLSNSPLLCEVFEPTKFINRLVAAWEELERDWSVEDDALFPVYQAATRYLIARDFGEFDPDRADMLWKLKNGGQG